MKHVLANHPIGDQFMIDSAGILDFHKGKPADQRMRAHAKMRNIEITSLSRPVEAPRDFKEFTHIIAMDERNLADLKILDKENTYAHKLFLMSEFFQTYSEKSVPDPYYGDGADFDLVLDMVTEGAHGLIKHLLESSKS